jgi:hypothetical protein
MDRACSTHGRKKRSANRGSLVCPEGKIIERQTLKEDIREDLTEMSGLFGLDSLGSGKRPVSGSCEHHNELKSVLSLCYDCNFSYELHLVECKIHLQIFCDTFLTLDFILKYKILRMRDKESTLKS